MRADPRLLLAALLLTLTGCGAGTAPAPTGTPVPAPTPTPAPTAAPTPTPDPVRARLDAMTLEEQVGQLFVVGFAGTTPGEDVKSSLEELHAGGVILFRRNVESAGQLTELTNALKAMNPSQIPLFLGVDQEGGTVERMPPEIARLPSAYEASDPALLGQALAAECAAFGFNLDFAPSFDVWSNPKNTVIGTRAFSSDPQAAGQAAALCVQALRAGGIIPVAKHFPGHGDTDVDSHAGLPVLTKSREDWERLELAPFRTALETGMDAFMVSHIVLGAVDETAPATLSKPVLTGVLRGELGFDGVIFTDDMTMGAITQNYGLGEACILALEAGCDVLLVCHGQEDIRSAYDAVLEAARSGRIDVEEHVYRVLDMKARYGLTDQPVPPADVAALNELVARVRGE